MTGKTSEDLIQAEAELLSAGIALQEQGLALLLAEMQALKGVMSGSVPVAAAAGAELDCASAAWASSSAAANALALSGQPATGQGGWVCMGILCKR